MTNKYLLDSNILIKALEDRNSPERHRFIELLSQPDSIVYITPLIYYEVLRGVNWKNVANYESYVEQLNLLSNLNIDKSIAAKAIELFRFERDYRAQYNQQSKKPDKHNFDIMHFATANVYGLVLASNDQDFRDWEELNLKLIASQQK